MSNFPSVKAKDFVKVIEKLGFHLVVWASRPSSAGKMPTPQENLLQQFSLDTPLLNIVFLLAFNRIHPHF